MTDPRINTLPEHELIELRARVERLEKLLADHYHAHNGTPCTTGGRWPSQSHTSVQEVLAGTGSGS